VKHKVLSAGFAVPAPRNSEDVTAIILVGLVAAAVIGLGIAFGGPIVGAVLGGLAIIAAIVWIVAMGGSKTTAGEVARETHEQEFLGPGGPDDPNR
jgi:hypothetical protein